MKKLLTLVLALAMVCSLSVTVFAEGEQSGSTTITVAVPEKAPCTYTIHIPADATIEYGNTDVKYLGTAYATDIQNKPDGVPLSFKVYITQLEDGKGNTIPTVFYFKDVSSTDQPWNFGDECWYNAALADEHSFSVQVPSWDDAVPGTYNAAMTFVFGLGYF